MTNEILEKIVTTINGVEEELLRLYGDAIEKSYNDIWNHVLMEYRSNHVSTTDYLYINYRVEARNIFNKYYKSNDPMDPNSKYLTVHVYKMLTNLLLADGFVYSDGENGVLYIDAAKIEEIYMKYKQVTSYGLVPVIPKFFFQEQKEKKR